jgi:hypothetical protein
MNNDAPIGSIKSSAASDGSAVHSQEASSRPRDVRANTGDAVAKLTDVAQQAGQQAKESVTSLASEANEKTKGMLNEQIAVGAGLVAHIADSIEIAAKHLAPKAPQLAGFVRGAAEMSKDMSRNLQGKSVDEIFQSASDFTRRQPAVVFGTAALVGFFVFRLLKASPSNGSAAPMPRQSARSGHQRDNFHGS